MDWWFYYLYNRLKHTRAFLSGILYDLGLSKTDCNLSGIRQYAGKKVLSVEEAGEYIYRELTVGAPFMACRFGANEMGVVASSLTHRHVPLFDGREKKLKPLCTNAGFFPDDLRYAEQYVELMLDSCSEADLCGIWRLFMEDYVLRRYASACEVTLLGSLEPWSVFMGKERFTGNAWTAALKGKKVLVIHPFVQTIREQYENNREKIFANLCEADRILPAFELKTLKAVQTIYGEEARHYSDWFDALEHMVQQCREIDFDIAIIGCGAYGFPLAAAVKRMGKAAVHLGGATQLLFGIRGKRWDDNYKETIDKMANDAWTRPNPLERPSGADKVEHGCYW